MSSLSAHPTGPPHSTAFARLIPGETAVLSPGTRKPPTSVRRFESEKIWQIADSPASTAAESRWAFLLPPPLQSRNASSWVRLVTADFALVTLDWFLLGALLVLTRTHFPAAHILTYATGGASFLLGMSVLQGALITLIGYSSGLYVTSHEGSQPAKSLANAVFWSTVILTLASSSQGAPMAKTGLFIAAGALHFGMLRAWRSLTLFQAGRSTQCENARNVLIVGAGALGRHLASSIRSFSGGTRNIRGFLDDDHPLGNGVIGRISDLAALARAAFIDEVILAAPRDRSVALHVLQEARRLRLDVEIVPELFGCTPVAAAVESVGDLPMISLHAERLPAAGLFCKRLVDVIGSGIAMIVLSPLLAAIAALIKLDSSGPVLYSANRAGRKGMPFPCLKFRTMVSNADALKDRLRQSNQRSGPFFKIADDPRITRIGRFLRRYSLDELPQLWNVLRGEMSLVGPRPHPLDDFAGYLTEHLARLDMTPGITGLWQVTARRDPSFQRGMELDREYIQRWSLGLDMQILLKTFCAVVRGGGE